MAYELVVYAVAIPAASPTGARPARDRAVLSEVLPGSALSWTPPMERCLDRGSSYAWAVRALGPEVTNAWAEARIFRVAAAPSAAEVAYALRLLEDYVSIQRTPVDRTAVTRSPEPPAVEQGEHRAAARDDGSDPSPRSRVPGDSLIVNGDPVVTTTTDQDTLGHLAPCATGEVAKWTGTEWECAADADSDQDTLGALACASGQVAKWSGGLWGCADDDTLGTTLVERRHDWLVGSGKILTLFSTCAGGEVLLHGGFTTSGDASFVEYGSRSRYDGRHWSWEVIYGNTSPAPHNVRVIAVCLG